MALAPSPEAGPGVAGMVVLEDPGRRHRIVWADDMAEALSKRGVKVVVLNTCESAKRAGGPIFEWRGLAAALLESRIPAVVAMQESISDDAANAFMRGFYETLILGVGLDQAVASGRECVMKLSEPKNIENRDFQDWGVPVLYLSSPEGVSFRSSQSDDPHGKADGEDTGDPEAGGG